MEAEKELEDVIVAQRALEDARKTGNVEMIRKAEQQLATEQEEADEAWKESHCKMCPHCGKVVYKVDGCNVSGEENESYGFMVVVVVLFFLEGGAPFH